MNQQSEQKRAKNIESKFHGDWICGKVAMESLCDSSLALAFWNSMGFVNREPQYIFSTFL